MKVVMLTTSFPRYDGDLSGLFVLELAENLVKRGHEVTVIAPHDKGVPKEEWLRGIQIKRFQYFFPQSVQRLAYQGGIPSNLRTSKLAKLQVPLFLLSFFIRSFIPAIKSDVIHVHWIETGLVAQAFRLFFNRPIVLTVHRLVEKERRGNWHNRFVLSKTDHVFFNSSYTCNLAGSGIKSSSINPPSVKLERFDRIHSDREKVLRNYGIPLEGMVVFSLGMLVEKKGFCYLIEAISSVSKECPVFFAIGGEGPKRERLERLIEKYRVESLVKLVGRVATHDVPVLLKRADIFVLPSIVDSQGETETLGVVLLEALASETPCIASRVGGIVDIVEDGANGFLFKPGDSKELAQKILLLLKDKDLRLKMGKAGRKKIETYYTWNINAKRTEDIYRFVVNRVKNRH